MENKNQFSLMQQDIRFDTENQIDYSSINTEILNQICSFDLFRMFKNQMNTLKEKFKII
jgi:hypothetical protein